MVSFFGETVDGTTKVKNLPAGSVINVQTDADITIAFWNPAANAYGAAETISAPGDEVSCANQWAQLVAASPATVTITKGI